MNCGTIDNVTVKTVCAGKSSGEFQIFSNTTLMHFEGGLTRSEGIWGWPLALEKEDGGEVGWRRERLAFAIVDNKLHRPHAWVLQFWRGSKGRVLRWAWLGQILRLQRLSSIANRRIIFIKLIHIHQFPVTTHYASVIGYVKTSATGGKQSFSGHTRFSITPSWKIL